MELNEVQQTLSNNNEPDHHKQYHLTAGHKAIRFTLFVILKSLNVFYIPIFIWRLFQTGSKCSEVTDDILKIPANELVVKIANKQIKCQTVIESYIRRIQEVNPLLNAVIDDRFKDALEDAKNVDKLVENQEGLLEKYPLLGLPLTVKGSLAVKGLKFTSGCVKRKNHKAEIDADAVNLARQKGAIPLLVSNVPELCMSWETTNKLFGTTKNPHDTTRTCGGSSGGEATLLAAGASLIGIGSDIAGSLRLPAHYCGIWGHKPSPGIISAEGHFPNSLQSERFHEVFTLGPMTRYAGDLKLLLENIVISDKLPMLNLRKQIDLKNVKIFYSDHQDYFYQPANADCRKAVNKVVDVLSKVCNITPVEITKKMPHHTFDLSLVELLSVKDIEDMFDGNAKGVYQELLKYTTFRSDHSLTLILCGLLRNTMLKFPEKIRNKINLIVKQLKKDYEDILGENGIFILPTFPFEAPKHGDVIRNAICCSYLTIFNAIGFPVTNCPVGVTDNGLPIGIQIASRPFNDNLTLTVAEEIERQFGGWIEPKKKVLK